MYCTSVLLRASMKMSEKAACSLYARWKLDSFELADRGIRRINECASHLHSSSLLIHRSLDLTPFEAVAYRPSSWTFIYLPPLCIVTARTMCVWVLSPTIIYDFFCLSVFFFVFFFFRREWDCTHLLHIKPLKITEEILAVILLQVESKKI